MTVKILQMASNTNFNQIIPYWKQQLMIILNKPDFYKQQRYKFTNGEIYEDNEYWKSHMCTFQDFIKYQKKLNVNTCCRFISDHISSSNKDYYKFRQEGCKINNLEHYNKTIYISNYSSMAYDLYCGECVEKYKEYYKKNEVFYGLEKDRKMWIYGGLFFDIPWLSNEVSALDTNIFSDTNSKLIYNAIDIYVSNLTKKEFLFEGSDKSFDPDIVFGEWMPFEAYETGVFLVNINPKSNYYLAIATALFPKDDSKIIEVHRMYCIRSKEKEVEKNPFYSTIYGDKYATIDYYYWLYDNQSIRDNIKKMNNVYKGYNGGDLLLCWRDKLGYSTGGYGSRFLTECNFYNLTYIDDMFDDFVEKHKNDPKPEDVFRDML